MKRVKSKDSSRQENDHGQTRKGKSILRQHRMGMRKLLTAADWYEIGIILMQSDDPTLAISAFNRSIEMDPMVASAYLKRGQAHEMTGDYQSALADYRDASLLIRTKKLLN